MVQYVPIDDLIRLEYDPVKETLHDFLLVVDCNDSDLSPLPFVLVFELGQSHVKSVLIAIPDFVESLPLLLE